MTWPVAFTVRLRQDPQRRFFVVRIFPTVAAARADARRHECFQQTRTGRRRRWWNWSALTHGHQKMRVHNKTRRATDTGERGILWFAFSRLGAGVVSHEMTHAALRIAEESKLHVFANRGRFDVSRDEERFCYAQEGFVRQFWTNLYRHPPARRNARRSLAT